MPVAEHGLDERGGLAQQNLRLGITAPLKPQPAQRLHGLRRGRAALTQRLTEGIQPRFQERVGTGEIPAILDQLSQGDQPFGITRIALSQHTSSSREARCNRPTGSFTLEEPRLLIGRCSRIGRRRPGSSDLRRSAWLSLALAPAPTRESRPPVLWSQGPAPDLVDGAA